MESIVTAIIAGGLALVMRSKMEQKIILKYYN